MRRADRLFSILQILRRGKVVRAADLATHLEISERTVYRDMRDLMASGVPLEGEAGVGYLLRDGFDIPPLMFSADEIEALVVAGRLLSSWAGADLARAVANALDKIESVIPPERRADLGRSRLFAPDFNVPETLRERLDDIRQAINARTRIDIAYRRPDGTESRRRIHPYGLFYWGRVWTLAGWCELRGDYRNFRLDRMLDLRLTAEPFSETPERNLQDFLRRAAGDFDRDHAERPAPWRPEPAPSPPRTKGSRNDGPGNPDQRGDIRP